MIAKECGYIERNRKISGYDLLESCIFSRFEHDKLSLNDHCSYLLIHRGIMVSNQAIDKKFNEKSVMFLRKLLELVLLSHLKTNDSFPKLSKFNRVKIKDSVCFQAPDDFKNKYPGSGGAGSSAAVRIQFEYDLLSNTIEELKITPFNAQDVKDAQETIGDICENDLIIRDLGYITVDVLDNIERSNAFYINRSSYVDFHIRLKDGNFTVLDLSKVERDMRKNEEKMRIEEVYLGSKKKYKTNLIIEPVPDEIKNQRLRKRHLINRKKGRSAPKKALDREGLNLLLTNVPSSLLPKERIREIYGIRWQIEIIFKAWKSVGGLHKVKRMDIHRFEFYLFAKLIFIMINWNVLSALQNWTLKAKNKYISLYKLLKTILIAGPNNTSQILDLLMSRVNGYKIISMQERSKRINKMSIKYILNNC